ncbi:hypothetical protein VTN77DRAFT_6770 [Rasamsonia byssochlamydoides]|uniref:uncharacterized protein n=1 Tax=Rasamsonia byssochlamydoides TaxID=89139 RepID=UPI003742477D
MSPKTQTRVSDETQTSEGLEELVDDIRPKHRGEMQLDASWKALFYFTSRKHALTVAVACTLTILAGLVLPAFAIYLGKLFDSFTKFGSEDISGPQLLVRVSNDGLTLLGLGVIGWCANGSYFFSWVVFAELQARSARKKLFRALLNQELRWFDMRREGVGAFLSHAQKQIRELQIATSQPLGFTLQYLVRTVAALGLAFYTSWKVTLVTLAAVPFSSAMIAFLSSRTNPIIKAQQSKLTDASKLSYDAFTAVETVKCFNGQFPTYCRFVSCIKEAARFYLRLALLASLQIAVTRLMTFGMFVQGFWYGSSLVNSGQLSSGDVLRTFWACLTAIQSIEQIVSHLPALERGKIAGATLKSYLHGPPHEEFPVADRGACHPLFCRGDIEVRNVSFAYPSQTKRLVLRSTNIFFPAGKTTFVIGQSGSGKSTLANLLLRFYSSCSGEILIDKNPIQTIDTRWIRNNITLVQQQSFLFNETLLRNIVFGSNDRNDVTKQQIEACIGTAKLQDVISHLPEGLETVVGVGGNLLSGGQKQRVAIARARLRDSPILILDECTSALDYQNRIGVMDAIRTWRKGKTTIIITHDTSQILENDFAYVLEQGRVVASGYKMDLMGGSCNLFSGEDEGLSDSGSSNSKSPETSSEDGFFELSDNDSDTSSFASFKDRPRAIPLQTVYIDECSIPQYDDDQASNHSNFEYEHANAPLIRHEPATVRHKSHIKRVKHVINDDVGQGFSYNNPRSSRSGPSMRSSGPEMKRPKRKPAPEIHGHPILSLHRILLTIPSILSWKQRILLILALACAIMHASATPIFSYLLSRLFQAFYAAGNRANLARRWSVAVLGLAVGDATMSFVMHYVLEYCSQVWMDSLRNEAMRRILDQPRSWFEEEENKPLHLTVCLDQNAEEIRNLIGRFAGSVLVAAVTLIMAVVWSFTICWKLTLVSLACGPVMYIITKGLESVNREWESRSNDVNEAVASIFSETFSDIRTVRAFTLESYFHSKLSEILRKSMIAALKRAGYSGIFFGLVESAIIFASALLFYYGAVVTSSGESTATDIMSIFAMILFSIGYANTVISWIPQINSACETASRLLRLSRLPFASSHEHVGKLRVFEPEPVQFTNLKFRYPRRPEALVLRNFSLTIPASSCCALVGCSGSGKSTIASLLLGLYPSLSPLSGPPAITLGGVDIQQLHIPTLRSLVALVPQQPRLFADTIRANITYGLNPCSRLNSMKNIRAAAQAAGIDEFICSLPEGYSTLVGDGGLGLSGGQAQRLVIARALVRQPRILILDEATSNLDGESAEIIRRSIQKLVGARQGLTVILITHAREMMEMADSVVVIDGGSVVEQGPYHDLLQRPGGKLREMLAGRHALI